jgi:hypothetical protein
VVSATAYVRTAGFGQNWVTALITAYAIYSLGAVFAIRYESPLPLSHRNRGRCDQLRHLDLASPGDGNLLWLAAICWGPRTAARSGAGWDHLHGGTFLSR